MLTIHDVLMPWGFQLTGREINVEFMFFVRSELRFFTPAVLLVGQLVYLSVVKYFKVNNGDYVLSNSMSYWTWKQNNAPSDIVVKFSFRTKDCEFKGMNCSFAGYRYIARFYF